MIAKPYLKEQQLDQPKLLDLDQIPDNLKEKIICKKCQGEIFIPVHRWFKIKSAKNQYELVINNRSMCINCNELLPDKV